MDTSSPSLTNKERRKNSQRRKGGGKHRIRNLALSLRKKGGKASHALLTRKKGVEDHLLGHRRFKKRRPHPRKRMGMFLLPKKEEKKKGDETRPDMDLL